MTPESVRALVAALDLEGAKKLLDRLKAGDKTPEAKEAAKALERELALAKKIEPVARKQLPKLFEASKWQDALALAWATADRFPGAVALAALAAPAAEARDKGFEVVDDFDRSPVPGGKEHEGGRSSSATTVKPKRIGNLDVANSRIEIVADPLGGRALRWTWSELPAGAFTAVSWRFKALDLAGFDGAMLRLRSTRALGKDLHVQVFSGTSEQDRGKIGVPFKADGLWHEVRVPLDKVEKKGSFDPSRVVAFGLSTFAPPPVELFIDDVLLVRRAAK